MYDPKEDILTHPDFTEVNKRWDKISQENKQRLEKVRKNKLIVGGCLVIVGSAMILYDLSNRKK